MKHRILLAALALAAAGCATGAPVGGRRVGADARYHPFGRAAAARDVPAEQTTPEGPLQVPAGARDTAVQLAQTLVGKSKIVVDGKKYRDDCTGLIGAIYAKVGVDLFAGGEPGDNGVTAVWRFASAHGRLYEGGRPVGGDLVFFKDTYDLNRDGRINDGLTHIGLVEKVGEDGTVTVIHRVARGVVRYRMNLQDRDSATKNDYLRSTGAQAKPQLTSQLFAGYATLLPIEARLAAR